MHVSWATSEGRWQNDSRSDISWIMVICMEGILQTTVTLSSDLVLVPAEKLQPLCFDLGKHVNQVLME